MNAVISIEYKGKKNLHTCTVDGVKIGTRSSERICNFAVVVRQSLEWDKENLRDSINCELKQVAKFDALRNAASIEECLKLDPPRPVAYAHDVEFVKKNFEEKQYERWHQGCLDVLAKKREKLEKLESGEGFGDTYTKLSVASWHQESRNVPANVLGMIVVAVAKLDEGDENIKAGLERKFRRTK